MHCAPSMEMQTQQTHITELQLEYARPLAFITGIQICWKSWHGAPQKTEGGVGVDGSYFKLSVQQY